MKQIFLAVGVSFFTIQVNAQAKPKKVSTLSKGSLVKPAGLTLKNSVDSFSYALGMNIANNLKQQGIEKVNNAAMQKALDYIIAKKQLLLNEQQANMCIQQKLQENMSKKNDATRAKGDAFLAENKKREGVITLPSGLQYEVLMKGDANSKTPRVQDTVVVHYSGKLIDSKEPFDNSYQRGEPLTIGVGGVISGWTEILQLMHVGDKFKVYIPSELGYGERGAGAGIPGGSTLIFEMELVNIIPAAAEAPKP